MEQIPEIFCINLYEREDKYKQMCQTFKERNLLNEVKWHRVHKSLKGGKYGCYESHLNVFKKALKLNLPYILVCEDDIYLNENFKSELEKVVNLIKDSNFKWDIIKFNDHGLFLIEDEMNFLYRAKTFGGQCYLINNATMKKMVNIGIIDEHVDYTFLFVAPNMFLNKNKCINLTISDSDNDAWGNDDWGVISKYFIPLMFHVAQYSQFGYSWGTNFQFYAHENLPFSYNIYKQLIYSHLDTIKDQINEHISNM